MVPKKYLNKYLKPLSVCETIRTFSKKNGETSMKLTTDLSVRKWKPRTEGERVSCGDSLYLQGYSNGTRAYIFRAQPIVDGKQKSLAKLGKQHNQMDHQLLVSNCPLRMLKWRYCF